MIKIHNIILNNNKCLQEQLKIDSVVIRAHQIDTT